MALQAYRIYSFTSPGFYDQAYNRDQAYIRGRRLLQVCKLFPLLIDHIRADLAMNIGSCAIRGQWGQR
jgi:hypothetical protein